ncbi:glycosyltransferase family 9 protein [Massilia sp. RP-1-19]|uniref:Glycosyltransferase family 9 protein n=1 Tax=Massilia polaris TaxID=2728846 RepID=A0A848HQB6_9BURK|nr:glycosyltransferase family 9 protein [Massilia polaris]NML62309.1 glycosyltransferase family 9 protein [Massilia polaris]
MTSASWDDARSVLCVRLDSLGDVLMCTPAIRALKQSRPGRCVTLLSSPGGAAAAPFIPELDAVLVYPAPWMKSSARHLPAVDMAFIATLAARSFDAAAIFTSYSQSALPAALMCYLAGIPLRLAHCRENPYHLLSDWLPDPEPDTLVKHEVRRQLDLAASVGCTASSAGLSFAVRDNDIEAVAGRLAARGINATRQWVLLHPGASAPSRRYPPGQWARVLEDLAARTGLPMVLTGDAAEQPLIEQIVEAGGSHAVSLAGLLDLGELGAAIKLASLVISNNTGPAHMAAAVGTPLVVLYALTNPQHTPWQVECRVLFHDVPCRFCQKSVCPHGHNDCLKGITPERVVDAACGLLARSARMTLQAMLNRPAG